MPREPKTTLRRPQAPGTSLENKENLLNSAVNDLRNDPHLTIRSAAQHYGSIPFTTLEGRMQGRKERSEAHNAQRVMDRTQEDEFAEFLREMDGWGLHLRLDMIKERAQKIVASSGSTHVLGPHWVNSFLKRHPDLKSALSQRQDILRAAAEKDPVRLDHFFANIRKAFDKYQIHYENLYNIDEKGFLLGIPWRSHVVVVRRPDWPRHSPTAPKSPNREIITVIDCICADGTFLPPFLIMKGKRPSFGWVKDSELDEHGFIAASENGWTDNVLGRAWLEDLFDPQTREKAAGRWRCIVLDNHESHVSFEFIEYAWQNKIIVVSLEPHTSGKFQPLDVGCFRDYQMAYGKAADDEIRCGNSITKQDFPRLLPIARRKAFSRTNITRGFEDTGIWPLNPDRFDFLAEYHRQLQTHENAEDSISPPIPPIPQKQSQSKAVQRRTGVLAELDNMLDSPPPTPSKPIALAKKLAEEVVRGKVREELYSSRIDELLRTSKGRNKVADRRKPAGTSRIYEIGELNRLREERDLKSREKFSGRGRGRGSGRARGRGGISRGRGHAIASTQTRDLQDDADYIPDHTPAAPVMSDEVDTSDGSDCSSSSQFSFVPVSWN